MSSPDAAPPRRPLSRERIVAAAVDVADRDGLAALTMRRLGAELGVEAMSLYKHVANKEQILGAVVELLVGQIAVPDPGEPWRRAMRRRAASAREVLSGHSWAIGLLEGRGSTSPAKLRYLEAVLGNLRSSGFSIDDAAHAFWLLDSYVYGHVVQEVSLAPRTTSAEVGEAIPAPDTPTDLPHLRELQERARTSGYSVDREFAYGLELILDALERTVLATAGG